jgi:hypothetical protein
MMMLEDLLKDIAVRQKKGLHFIIASVFVWLAIFIIHLMDIQQLTKNLFTFFCTAPLVPLAILISKFIDVDFYSKDNPLAKLGLLFSLNQLLYLLLAMWIFPVVPDKFLMVMAMIFGAHLLPFTWLYQSISYLALAILIPLTALGVGLFYPPIVIAGLMFIFEIVFVFLLLYENRQ